MEWRDRIVADPGVLCGKPVVRGTRIAVEHVLELLGQGWPESDVLEAFSALTQDDILACLRYPR